MSWFLKGVQSAIFHYASCAPCTGYVYKKQRRKQAKKTRKEKDKLQLEQPDLYHHPGPTGTNPYWQEEIELGPGPPPRRARRTNTGSQRGGVAKMNTSSTVVSQGSSTDASHEDRLRLSDDTLEDDENWNRKRYQREDEDLWGFGEPMAPVQTTLSASSIGVAGLARPDTSRSMRSESYCTARAPPVNDLHPPVVSLPSPHPVDNRWMLQPPPKASVMSGKVRATHRSRSGSGASSRVELSLQRQVSAKHLKQKMERGETPDAVPMSRGSSYTHILSGQRHDRPRTPVTRPPSAASSRRRKRRDAATIKADRLDQSSADSSDTRAHGALSSKSTVASLHVVRVRSSRQQLSTVLSSGTGGQSSPNQGNSDSENRVPEKRFSSTQSTESSPYLVRHRTPLASSDLSSLNVLQDLVSPHALLNSRLIPAPLMEARIKLPPSDKDEEKNLSSFALGRDWNHLDTNKVRVPFDSALDIPERDPRLRWSVDF